MTTMRDTAAEVAATEAYRIYWLRHELVQAEAKGDAKEMARLTKELAALPQGKKG